MSDSEEDYMSEKVLKGCYKNDVRPGLLFNKTLQRKHDFIKNQQEKSQQQPKSYQNQEKEARERGLSTALSSDNKGFKLLEKMGYKPGTGLGKSITGITEPVAVKTKEDVGGVGRKNFVKEAIKRLKDLNEMKLEATQKKFRLTNAERHSVMMLHKDYKNAQRTCEELDFQFGMRTPENILFWSKLTLESLKQKNNEKIQKEDEDPEENEQEEINESKLCDIIMYLRKKYCYCLYCGDYFENLDKEVLLCPGKFRKDHFV